MVKKQGLPGSVAVVLVAAGVLGAVTACIRMPEVTGPAPVAPARKEASTTVEPFELKPDWAGPCARAEAVDVNLGNTPGSFVRAAHCQVTGEPATDKDVALWTARTRGRIYARPYLLPVLVGTTVDFLNSDSVNHNVFSPDGEGYNLGTWPKGQSKSYTFKKAGVYTQLCSVHPEMEAFVIVLANPYFAVADKDGKFTINDVPDGHYDLKVFSKKLKKAEKEKKFGVDVAKGAGTATIAF